MSDSFIYTINDQQQQRKKSKRDRSQRNTDFDPYNNASSNPAQLIDTLNSVKTWATIIIDDNTPKKKYTFELLSQNSGTAKNILKDIEDDREYLHLNTTKAVNVLKLLSNVFDNNI